jgi:hypothetical protein
LVAVTQIDSPQNIFSAGVNRGAAIVVGIAALALISDVFAAPNVHTYPSIFARNVFEGDGLPGQARQ